MAHVKRKLPPALQVWMKHGRTCRAKLGIKPFQKTTAAQKAKVKACVMAKAKGGKKS